VDLSGGLKISLVFLENLKNKKFRKILLLNIAKILNNY
jgi:hypothetical protein